MISRRLSIWLLLLIPALVTTSAVAQPVLTSIDFENYTAGAGTLATNPSPGEPGFSSYVYPWFPLNGTVGDPIQGIVAQSPLGTGQAAYLGGDGTALSNLPEQKTRFNLTVFSGAFDEVPANLIGTARSHRKIAVDFLIERHDGTNQQSLAFYVYDAKKAPSPSGFHSYVRINADNTVSIADNDTVLIGNGYTFIPTGVTLQPGVGYRLELFVNYDAATWSARIAALDGSATYVVATDRAINTGGFTLSGWTTPGTVDIEMGGAISVSDHALADRFYLDNLKITAEADQRLWHEQTADDINEYGPGRVIPDGQGGLLMPWTIYQNGYDMIARHLSGQLVRVREADGRRDPAFTLDARIKRVAFAAVQPDHKLVLAADIGDVSTVVRVDETGAIDPTFTAPYWNRGIRFLTIQPDGKILVAITDGYNSAAPAGVLSADYSTVLRLNADGTIDPSYAWTQLTAGSGTVFAPPAVDAQGRVYLAGAFTGVNGNACRNVVRLSSTGVFDPSFAAVGQLPAGFGGSQARGIGIQSDGSVIFVGEFYYTAHGSRADPIMAVRFKPDGTFDTGFAQPLRSALPGGISAGVRLRAMQMLADDRFLAVSDRLVRFNADGTVDGTFLSAPFVNEAYWVAVGSDGRYYVPSILGAGQDDDYVDLQGGFTGAFSSEGLPDPSFRLEGWGKAAFPSSFSVLEDGSLFLAGVFNRFGSVPVPGVARFGSDGSFSGAPSGLVRPDGEPFSLTSASVAGTFGSQTFVLWQEEAGNFYVQLARLNADGSLDATFTPQVPDNFGIYGSTLTATLDGRLLLNVAGLDPQALLNGATNGTFIRLNWDGSFDSSFAPAIASPGLVERDAYGDISNIVLGTAQVAQALPDGGILMIVTDPATGTVRLSRLTESGALDATFATPALGLADVSEGYTSLIYDPVKQYTGQFPITSYYSTLVRCAQEMWDGRVYVGGALKLAGAPRGLVRLTATGALDDTFAGDGIDAVVQSGTAIGTVLALTTDDYRRLYVAGRFANFNGQAVHGLFRLKADGTLDSTWQHTIEIADYPQATVGLQVKNNKLYVTGTVRDAGGSYPDAWRVIDLDVPETAPTITGIADVTIPTNSTTDLLPFTVDDNETYASQLEVSATSDNESLVPAAGGIVIGFGQIEGNGGAVGLAVGARNPGLRFIRVLPAQGKSGTAKITVTVSDGTQQASTSFTLTVDAPPTISAIADQSLTEDNAAVTIPFTVGDDATAADKIAVTRATSNATLLPLANIVLGGSGANRTVKITPVADQSGSANVTLTATDGRQQTFNRSFTVNVKAVNDAPTITAVANQTVALGGATAVLPFTVADKETAAASLKVTAASSNLTVVPAANIALGGSGANRTVKVTAAAGKTGSSTITLTVNDGGATATSTFTLTVDAPPTISDIADQALNKNNGAVTIPFTVGDDVTATDKIALSAATSNATLFPLANIVLGGSGANRTVKITPAANQSGSATITLTAADSRQQTSSRSFTVRVNDAPTITTVANQTVALGGATAVLPFTVADKETAAASLKVTAASSNLAVVPAANIALGGSGANRTIKVTALAGKTGSATITLTVSDGSLTATSKFTVTVNQPPTIATLAAQSVNEDVVIGPLAVKVGDVDTAVASLTLSGKSSNATLVPAANIVFGGSGANRTIKITPAANQSGTATITMTVSDGLQSTSSTFAVTVKAVNDAPTLSKIANQVIAKGKATGTLAFTVADKETAAAKLTVTKDSSNKTLIPVANIVLGGSGANRTVKITPVSGQTGSATITLTVSDGALTGTTKFTVKVDNVPTIAAVTSQTVNEDTSTAVLSFKIADAETTVDKLVVTAASSNLTLVPQAGITLGGTTGTRTVKVTPAKDQSGEATITLTVSDGALTASTTFKVTVKAVNDAPTISALANKTVAKNGNTGAIAFTIADVDTALAKLTVKAASGNTTLVPASGIVLGGSAGARTIKVTPAANKTGTAKITVTVSDGALSTSASFTVTVK